MEFVIKSRRKVFNCWAAMASSANTVGVLVQYDCWWNWSPESMANSAQFDNNLLHLLIPSLNKNIILSTLNAFFFSTRFWNVSWIRWRFHPFNSFYLFFNSLQFCVGFLSVVLSIVYTRVAKGMPGYNQRIPTGILSAVVVGFVIFFPEQLPF